MIRGFSGETAPGNVNPNLYGRPLIRSWQAPPPVHRFPVHRVYYWRPLWVIPRRANIGTFTKDESEGSRRRKRAGHE